MSKELTEQLSEITHALAPVDRSEFMPAMTISEAVERYNTITEFISRVLRRDVDYGMIPGTDKLTLLKPGAEKLTTFFGLSTRFQLIERIEDWTGENYHNEPFFYYLYRCQLYRGELLIAEADGSCNSREQKYRYREAQRVCPECNQAAIIKGREEYGGGWICFKKKGGCGAKFKSGDAVIESQATGRVPNPDIADQVNTIQKMGQKRSLVAATLLAVNASEFFTQDVEDMNVGPAPLVAPPVVDEESAARADAGARLRTPATTGPIRTSEPIGPASNQTTSASQAEKSGGLETEILKACLALGKTEEQLVDWLRKKYQLESIAGLDAAQQREVLQFLQGRMRQQQQQSERA